MVSPDALLRMIEDDLSGLWLPEDPLQECISAHRYPVDAGGKRVRPLLVLLAAAAVGGAEALERARPTATAIELLHTYSLVHDDLPCMDDDALRRGRPTTHVRYGEAKALLVGDGLLTHAFLLIASRGRVTPWLETLSTRDEACDAMEALSLAAGPYGMVGGQWLDISLTSPEEKRNTEGKGGAASRAREAEFLPRTFETVEHVHRLKTGRLLAAALECGVIHGWHARRSRGDASDAEPVAARMADDDVGLDSAYEQARELARAVGENVGIAFQIVDDILDVTASSAALGKTAGKDLDEDKLTSVTTLGLAGAKARAADFTARATHALQALFAVTTPSPSLSSGGTNGSAVAVEMAAREHLEKTILSLLGRDR